MRLLEFSTYWYITLAFEYTLVLQYQQADPNFHLLLFYHNKIDLFQIFSHDNIRYQPMIHHSINQSRPSLLLHSLYNQYNTFVILKDYYIWKSQESLLRFSSSGHVLVKEESTLPKTYSTRRGPLLLYSQVFVCVHVMKGIWPGTVNKKYIPFFCLQDLVTMETSCESEAENRKKRLARRYTEQVERQLSTLKELTAAILRYGKNQV